MQPTPACCLPRGLTVLLSLIACCLEANPGSSGLAAANFDYGGILFVARFCGVLDALLIISTGALQGNQAAFDNVFAQANFHQFVFRVRCHVEQVQDEQRMKCSADKAEPVNFKTESQLLLQAIAKF